MIVVEVSYILVMLHDVGNKPYYKGQGTGDIMTRKDYQLIATAIKQSRDESLTAKGEFAELVETLCKALQAESALFKREKFENACGL